MNDITENQLEAVIERTVDLIVAYVANNPVPANELPALIVTTYKALTEIGRSEERIEPVVRKLTAAQIRKSMTPDALISFIDGKQYKTLKRHLTRNDLTIETYRERYGLPQDYPSIAATYSAQRSKLARSHGLGQRRKTAERSADATVETEHGA